MSPKATREVKKMQMSVTNKALAIGIAVGLLGVGTAYTQFGGASGAEYATAGMNPQRTSYAKTDKFISKDNFSKSGFRLQWKLKFDTGHGTLIGGTTSGGGLTKPLDAVVGSNNTIFSVDDDTGVPGWVRHFDVASAPAAATAACPAGVTANASRPVNLTPPPAAAARGGAFGRAPAGYMSVVGDPGQGLPANVVTRGGRAPVPPAAPGAPGAAPAPAFGGGGRGLAEPTYKSPFAAGRFGSGAGFYVVTSDGVLHTVGDGSGKELQAPVPFLPANARVSDLTAVPENNSEWHSFVIYAATENGCGGVPNRVWAINLADDAKPITHVDTGASVVGDPAFSSDGTLFVAVGKGAAGAAHSNAILALAPKTLEIKDSFTDPKASFASTPMVIASGDKEIVAAATTDGRIYLLDATSLKTPLYVSPAFSSAKSGYVPPALASWTEADGTTYIAEPFAGAGPSGLNATVTNGGILALKVTGSGSSISLTPAWVSPDMTSPLSPVIVSGVMFAASSGEYHSAAGAATAAERAQKSVPAVLYALDASSGQPLWSSGKTITSFVAGTPLWTGAGQAYVATNDGTVYAFGFSEERYPTQGQ
jgi:hypothetical protein